MSHDTPLDAQGQAEFLPAELEAIGERLTTDTILWERRLRQVASAERLDAFAVALTQALTQRPVATPSAGASRPHAHRAAAPRAPRPPIAPRRARVLRATLAAVAAVALFAVLLVGAGHPQGVTGRPTTTPSATDTPTATGTPIPTATPLPLPAAGTVIAAIPGIGTLGAAFPLYGIAADDSTVWVHNGDTGMLLRIDPRTNTVVAIIRVGRGQGGVAIGDRAIWVANPAYANVARVGPATNTVVATIPLGSRDAADAADAADAIVASPDSAWITDVMHNAVRRIDPATNTVVATIFQQATPTDLALGAGSGWACNRYDTVKGLTRFDPATGRVEALIGVAKEGRVCTAVVALSQVVWTVDLNLGDGSTVVLTRIDPATNTVVALVTVPNTAPYHFAADDRGVWLWGPDEGLLRVDPRTDRVVSALPLKGGAAVALGAGSVWFADATTGTLLRIAPAP